MSTVTHWRPRPSAGGIFGTFAACAVLLAALGAAYWATDQPVGLTMFLGLVAAVGALILTLLVAIWTYGFYTLTYRLGDDELTIDWLFRQERVPYRAIDAVYGGQCLTDTLQVHGISCPGYYVGRGRARNLGVLRVFSSTCDRSALTILLTELGGYVLSPDDAFRNALVQRLQEARQQAPLTAASREARPRQWARALADPWLLSGVLVSLAIVVGMLGYIMDRYESLPELLALRFDEAGEAAYIRPRFELFYLPSLGAAVLLLDILIGLWVYHGEPLAARLLWAAPVLVQGILAVAVLRTIG